MTRKFTFLILATLFAILRPGAKAWGQTTVSVELCTSWNKTLAYATAYTQDYTIDDLNSGTTTMTLGVQGVYRQSKTDTYFQMNKNTGYFKNTTKLPGKITKIETTWSVAKGPTKCYFATNAEASSSDKTVTVTAATSVTYTPPTDADYYFFNIDVSTGSGSAQMTSCKVYYEGGDTPSAELVSIAISGTPTKTEYEAGESFDPAGLVVMGTYDDESTAEITSGITWNVTPNPLTAGITSVSITATVGTVTSETYVVDGLTVNEFVQTYANTYTSNVELTATGGTSASVAKVKWKNVEYNALKCGTSSAAGACVVTIPANTQTLHFHAAGWNGETVVLNETINLVADAGVSSNSPFTLKNDPETQDYFTLDPQGATSITFTATSGKRFVLFGVNAEEAPTQTLESISVKTAPTKTTYFVGETFAPAGLVITANYDSGDPEDIAYAGNESKFSFEPNLETALTTANDKVTITYGGKSCDQAITVNLNKLATPTNLQATNVTSTSATLTWDAVENASSYDVKLSGETRTSETNSLLVENLTESTTYTWTVKAKGDNTTYEDSEASEESNFTTLAPPSVAYTVTFDGNGHGTPASESITESSAGAGVTLPNCTPNAGYQFVGWATTNTATEADAGEAGATYYPTANITLYAVYNRVYTINYMVNGVSTSPQENVLAGTPLVFPEVTAPDADHVFRGWVTEAIEGTTDIEPTYENTTGLTATQNITYYAVFAEKSEGEATWNIANDIAANDVIIIATNKNYTDHDMKTAGTISSNIMSCKASTFNSDKTQITSVADGTLEFTLGGNSTSGWTLQNGTNYLGMSGDKKVALSSTSSTWTISISNGVATVSQNYSSKDYTLQYNYNNGSDRFTGYTSNQVAISLYKKTQGITYSNFCTTVVTKVLTSISLSGEYPTEFWKGDAFSHEGMTVTAHYDDESTKDVTSSATFTGYDMATAGEQTVTVTYDTQSTTYDITVKPIANTQETAYTVAEAKSLIDVNPAELATTEVYVKGTVSNIVTAFDANYGNISFDVSEDGETTGQQFRFYRNFKGADKTKWTSAEECPAVGDDVIGVGTMKKYTNSGNVVYEFDEGNYLVYHIKASTLSIENITVEIDGDIVPVIETNVVGDYTISYTSDNEEVVSADGDEMITIGLGEATITATLTADGYKEATTTFEVEVIKALTSITVATEPTVTSYKVGDVFDPTGLVITATYSDETTEDIAYEENEDKFTFEPSLETELTTDITSVTITYADKVSTTQEISVRALYTYDITWMANGEQFTATQVTEGNTLVLPETSPANVGDMKFQGWTDSENYYSVETAPEYIVPDEIIPIEAMTFYAVYAKHTSEFQEKDVTYTFTSMSWADATSSWTSGKDGNQYTTNQGVQVTTGVTGANATSKSAFTKVTKVVVNYCTNTSNGMGTIQVKVGDGTAQSYSVSAPSDGGTTLRNTDDMIFDSETGKVNITVECTTNSIYINSITITSKVGEETISNFCTTVEPIEEDKTISSNTIWDGNITINEHTVTIGSNAVLTVNGALINTDPEKLIIEDGGQLIFNNAGVLATMKKNINCSTSKTSNVNWYTISSPLAANTEFADVTNLIPTTVAATDYDLYYLDEKNGIWVNARLETGANPDFTTIDKGVGYIYHNDAKTELAFAGEINVDDVECTLTNGAAHGFNLIGNPFMQNITLDNVEPDGTAVLAKGFYVLSNENTWGARIESGTIAPLQGFLVQATEAGGVTISKNVSSKGGRSNEQSTNIEVIVSNSSYTDNAYAMFGEGVGLNKVNHRNAQAPMLYIPQDGENFAIAFMDENTTVFPVNFKAMTTGSYSISLKPTDDVSTLVLVDNMTGVETNMLLEESYKFIGSPRDNENRFTVKFEVSQGQSQNDDEHFVYQNGSELVVNGEGTLQIFDVLGRVVVSEEVHDQTVNVGGLNTGAYIVRLTGEGVMTQKIVVR